MYTYITGLKICKSDYYIATTMTKPKKRDPRKVRRTKMAFPAKGLTLNGAHRRLGCYKEDIRASRVGCDDDRNREKRLKQIVAKI